MQNKPVYNAAREKAANHIGRVIAERRICCGMSLAGLSGALACCGVDISPAGINKWELGKSVPGAYQLMALAQVLGLQEDMSLFSSRGSALNGEGLQKLRDYREDLIASGRYAPKAPPAPDNVTYIFMPVSDLPVSAGPGAFLEEDMFTSLPFPKEQVPRGTDFGLRIRGDSMEPKFHDEQIVWVRRCDRLLPGQIGIFIYEDCGYIKQYALREPLEQYLPDFTDSDGNVLPQTVMVSLNPAYAPIYVSPEASFRVVGRVIGQEVQ